MWQMVTAVLANTFIQYKGRGVPSFLEPFDAVSAFNLLQFYLVCQLTCVIYGYISGCTFLMYLLHCLGLSDTNNCLNYKIIFLEIYKYVVAMLCLQAYKSVVYNLLLLSKAESVFCHHICIHAFDFYLRYLGQKQNTKCFTFAPDLPCPPARRNSKYVLQFRQFFLIVHLYHEHC